MITFMTLKAFKNVFKCIWAPGKIEHIYFPYCSNNKYIQVPEHSIIKTNMMG